MPDSQEVMPEVMPGADSAMYGGLDLLILGGERPNGLVNEAVIGLSLLRKTVISSADRFIGGLSSRRTRAPAGVVALGLTALPGGAAVGESSVQAEEPAGAVFEMPKGWAPEYADGSVSVAFPEDIVVESQVESRAAQPTVYVGKKTTAKNERIRGYNVYTGLFPGAGGKEIGFTMAVPKTVVCVDAWGMKGNIVPKGSMEVGDQGSQPFALLNMEDQSGYWPYWAQTIRPTFSPYSIDRDGRARVAPQRRYREPKNMPQFSIGVLGGTRSKYSALPGPHGRDYIRDDSFPIPRTPPVMENQAWFDYDIQDPEVDPRQPNTNAIVVNYEVWGEKKINGEWVKTPSINLRTPPSRVKCAE
jgi:hypothetical protein